MKYTKNENMKKWKDEIDQRLYDEYLGRLY